MQWQAKWIKPAKDYNPVCPVFLKGFTASKEFEKALLKVTALGVYEAHLNDKRVGDFILSPGWTSYDTRLQYQEYDITEALEEDNYLQIIVGKGWYRGRIPGWEVEGDGLKSRKELPPGLLAQITIFYADGTQEIISTDESWVTKESAVRFSEIYDGEIYDASFTCNDSFEAEVFDGPFHTLIPQQGEEIKEQERLCPMSIFTTPKNEVVIDFGQEITGYVEIRLNANSGDEVVLSHAEVLDKEGNFYTENYRGAKSQFHYICKDGEQTYKPKLTFFGFRYIRVEQFPGGVQKAGTECFTAVTVHSQMKRTGYISSSSLLLNKLLDNVMWGQKGNFLDVPTDCPQRDERLGWTGDAQAFIRTACYYYDTERFYTKWLADMAADQGDDGRIGYVVPDVLQNKAFSTAWGDAAAICPWELYLAYGNKELLSEQYETMKKWVGFITKNTTTPYLWTGADHLGDWLGLDAPSGSYTGSSRKNFIATAFYAHSTSLVIKAGKALDEDVKEYEALHRSIVKAFRNTYPEYLTQTECILAVHFNLADDCQAAADRLAEMVNKCGVQIQTGFVGTPYILHVLSSYGHTELAYSLLLREKYPSWIYPVTKGATTVWEHWDGIMENGDFWSSDMNSFNHYAYGAVADWVFGVAAGIMPMEEAPGYKKVKIAPVPDKRMDWLDASYESRHGTIRSRWRKTDNSWRYDIETPVEACIIIDGVKRKVSKGTYVFFSPIK